MTRCPKSHSASNDKDGINAQGDLPAACLVTGAGARILSYKKTLTRPRASQAGSSMRRNKFHPSGIL
jgi:hypothetical protein